MGEPGQAGEVVHLRRDGISVVVELGEAVPRLLHWGGELDDPTANTLPATADGPVLNSSIDQPRRFSLWPTEAEGWSGMPAHEGHADGVATTPRLTTVGVHAERTALRLELHDAVADLDIHVEYRLQPGGVLAVTPTLRRRGRDGHYDLAAVQALLPVPPRADELLDFTGRWCRERAPQRRSLGFGSYVRDVRRGRPGHDSPFLMVLGDPGFGFRSGEVWGVHVGWSGNQRYLAERLPEGAGAHGAVLGAGELLRPGEIRLGPGDEYAGPTVYFGYSAGGLDGLAERFHRMIRSRAVHPATPRRMLLNTWEAVYFDHDLDRLTRLAETAAATGVELFVLDDGWFNGRRDPTAGLGDWTVDPTMWPQGLAPLVDTVHRLGLRFGLWVEPEMVNLDSDVAREHPDWVLAPSAGLGPSARHQYVLDLSHDKAWQHVFEQLDALIGEYRLDFLKWDHNRDLLEAVSRSPDGRDRPAVHTQTAAVYRLLDALRAHHPDLEIESCASGGARVDLGILARTDRVWASDTNDPYERQRIQRWTAQLLPPELIGAHVGGATSHTTGRTTSRSFQLVTALFGHAGIEADLAAASAAELDELAAWTGLYRELRPLLHSGRVVRADLAGGDEAPQLLHGVVAADGEAAVFAWVQLATVAVASPGRVPLPGLDDGRDYVVRVRDEAGRPSMRQLVAPPWLATAQAGGLRVPGQLLTRVGLPMPSLDPGQALLLHAVATD
ncbi:MAG TPA: alpha-galactosidase [Jatrophihabitantaceae bacterium]